MPKKTLSDTTKEYQKKPYPLFAALIDNDMVAFRELVENSPKAVEAVDKLGTPILYKAFLKRNLAAAEILLENGADPNPISTFLTPPLLIVHIVTAVELGFIKLLIDHGASIDKEIQGISVISILNEPLRYIKQLFQYEHSPEATLFLEKAEEMKKLIISLKKESAANLVMTKDSASMAIATGKLRNRHGSFGEEDQDKTSISGTAKLISSSL